MRKQNTSGFSCEAEVFCFLRFIGMPRIVKVFIRIAEGFLLMLLKCSNQAGIIILMRRIVRSERLEKKELLFGRGRRLAFLFLGVKLAMEFSNLLANSGTGPSTVTSRITS